MADYQGRFEAAHLMWRSASRQSPNIMADVEQILRLNIRMIKIHPPHQLLFPNDYLNGVKELEIIYRAAEANGVP